MTTSKGRQLLGKLQPVVDPDADVVPPPGRPPAQPAATEPPAAPVEEQPVPATTTDTATDVPARPRAAQASRPRRPGGQTRRKADAEQGGKPSKPDIWPVYLSAGDATRVDALLRERRIEFTPWVLEAYRNQRDGLAATFGVVEDDELPPRTPRRARIEGRGTERQLRPTPAEAKVLDRRRETCGSPSRSSFIAKIVELELGPAPKPK